MLCRRLIMLSLGLITILGGCQCRAPESHPITPTVSTSTGPEVAPVCRFTVERNATGDWQVRTRSPDDRENEDAVTIVRKKPGSLGGLERKVDPKYKWEIVLKEYGTDEIILVVEFDSMESQIGLSIAGAGTEIVRASEDGKQVPKPFMLKPGKHSVEVVARKS